MPANSNWARWIHASLGKYLKNVATTISIPSLLEGIDDRDPDFMESPDRIEIRVNGPFTHELSAGYFRLFVDVNVLVNSMMGGEAKQAYKLDDILGVYHNAMDGAIAIYRLGTGLDDDQSLLGCLTPRPGRNESIRVIHFGQLDRTDRIKQGMVDARFIMYLNE